MQAIVALNESVVNLRQQNERIEPAVQALRQRKRLQEEIRLGKSKLAWMAHKDVQEQYDAAAEVCIYHNWWQIWGVACTILCVSPMFCEIARKDWCFTHHHLMLFLQHFPTEACGGAGSSGGSEEAAGR